MKSATPSNLARRCAGALYLRDHFRVNPYFSPFFNSVGGNWVEERPRTLRTGRVKVRGRAGPTSPDGRRIARRRTGRAVRLCPDRRSIGWNYRSEKLCSARRSPNLVVVRAASVGYRHRSRHLSDGRSGGSRQRIWEQCGAKPLRNASKRSMARGFSLCSVYDSRFMCNSWHCDDCSRRSRRRRRGRKLGF